MTKVYFACSVRGGGDTSTYVQLLETIRECGGTILSEVFVNDAITLGGSPLPADEIYNRDIAMITEADVVIAEVSNPSLGVGYELAYAEKINKPILCLFNKQNEKALSAMVLGNSYNQIIAYEPHALPNDAIQRFLAQ